MDYCKKTIKKVFLLVILMTVMLGFFHPNHSSAVSGLTIDPDAVEEVEINALIMEVNILKSYMIVAEKKIDISEFKMGDKTYKTSLLDKQGNAVQLNAFQKGQRVLVRGFKLSGGVTVAEIIQEVSASEKGKRK